MTPKASPKRRSALRIALAVVVYGAVAVLAFRALDVHALEQALTALRAWHVGAILLVSLAHILGRALRYHALLSHASPRNYRMRDGIRVFLAGLSASAATPGRVGDFVKSKMTERFGVPVTYSAGIVVVERVLDLISVLLTLLGATFLMSRSTVASLKVASVIALVGLFAVVFVLGRKGLRESATRLGVRMLTRVRLTRAAKLVDEKTHELFGAWDIVLGSPSQMARWLVASILVWSIEFAKLWLVFWCIGSPMDPRVVFLVYPASIVAGVLSILPFSEGAVGVTATSMLVALGGADPSTATVAVVVDRAASVLPPIVMWGLFSLSASRDAKPEEP